jgi:DNA ligase-associated metallophosphoesterase
MRIRFGGEEFVLRGDKTMYWPDEGVLVVSDVHLGKVGHFRRAGLAVPKIASQTNLKTLAQAVEDVKPKKIVFLGDLFHSDNTSENDAFVRFLKETDAESHLIMGNHDVLNEYQYRALGLNEVSMGWKTKGLNFLHEPDSKTEEWVICGHIHPAIRLGNGHKQSMRLPCFWKGEKMLVLPSYGAFTGGHAIQPEPEDEVYALGEGRVFRVN